ncbi:hypothetical protein HEP89_29490 (plasmid) [Labrenzia sp. 5N]|uniref:hypothetical protein n=1 Tax=Labrenzia sp. 5N TaxID=2723402 RepID=UPI00144784A0|nr:hypothetical protein [Labrenzia sp. 5N]NKX68273.1 hypothetical protein [Labrenzia sp. 5N]
MSREVRVEVARRRIPKILGAHGIAVMRTIEHKIADAGPYNQRINPHLISEARNQLLKEGVIIRSYRDGVPWFHLSDAPTDFVEERYQEQLPVFQEVGEQRFTRRVGQSLEICVQKALDAQDHLDYFGRFTDLNEHDDSTLYSKEEPPSHLGARELPNKQKLDFLVRSQEGRGLWAGIEVKNVRHWLYPHQEEILELLRKCTTLDIVPVLIARRIPYVTGLLLRRCGAVTWETLRQRYPSTAEDLASRARHKRLLGYSDITLGTEPDGPLRNFIGKNLPAVLPEQRALFDEYKDLLSSFGHQNISYEEFAARVRRRYNGTNEDFDNDENNFSEEI